MWRDSSGNGDMLFALMWNTKETTFWKSTKHRQMMFWIPPFQKRSRKLILAVAKPFGLVDQNPRFVFPRNEMVWCVPPSSMCLPRWSGARVGVGMLRSARDSLTWKYKSYQMSISWFWQKWNAYQRFCRNVDVDLHHFPVPVFDFPIFQIKATFQNFKATKTQQFEKS